MAPAPISRRFSQAAAKAPAGVSLPRVPRRSTP